MIDNLTVIVLFAIEKTMITVISVIEESLFIAICEYRLVWRECEARSHAELYMHGVVGCPACEFT